MLKKVNNLHTNMNFILIMESEAAGNLLNQIFLYKNAKQILKVIKDCILKNGMIKQGIQ